MVAQLNPDISFCELDGQLFLLDIQHDRYFQLSKTLELAFRTYLRAPDNSSLDAEGLVKYGLLLHGPVVPITSAPVLPPPGQSVLERSCIGTYTDFGLIRDVFLALAVTYWQLKRRPLKSILQALSDYRQVKAKPFIKTQPEQQLVDAASAFNHLRPFVPIRTCCLIDSLSLVRFLAKQGLYSHLVMGVACDPFSAHAWVQQGSLLLNETLGTALAHVPIRVI